MRLSVVLRTAAVLLLLASGRSNAQTPSSPVANGSSAERRTMPAAELTGAAPVLDGRLDDAAWAVVPAQGGFVQRKPAVGAPATEPTEVRVVYDHIALYVAMRMADGRADSLAAPLVRRDAQATFSDWAYVMLDSYADHRTGFVFGVNPRGVQKDLAIYDDASEDLNWDAVWQVAVSTDSAGWSAEFRIPFSQLRFNPGRDRWGVNFQRRVARRDEWSFWQPLPPTAAGYVSNFGELAGLAGLSAPRHLEVQPYTVARMTRAPATAADPFRSNGASGSVGADLRYGLTSDVTLTATVNPDFGQVESDPSEVNLSAFETFFAEQRPFFVEGSDIFRFSVDGSEQLFYSRRIGRAPQGGVPGSAVYSDVPTASTILGAAKLTGKVAGGWTLGVLDALTAREEAPWVGSTGTRSTSEVEPMTNYGAARLIRSFNSGQSAVGALLTTTHRSLGGDPSLAFLPGSAYSGGLSARHRFGGGAYEASGWMVGSRVNGDTLALQRIQTSSAHYFQRPDSHTEYDPTATSMTGGGGYVSVSRIGGGNWRWGAIGQVRSPGLELNDLGYLREAGIIKQALYLGYTEQNAGRHLRSWNVYANEYTKTNWGGERMLEGMNVNSSVTFKNLWGAYLSLEHNRPVLSTDALRGGPALARPAQTISNFAMNTDLRRPLQFGVSGRVATEHDGGGRAASVSPEIIYRPSGRMNLSLEPAYSWLRNSWQYVATPRTANGPHYLIGTVEQKTAAITARLNYTFSPSLSLQFFAQPFVSAGSFGDYREVQDPRADSFTGRFRRLADAELAWDPATRIYTVDRDGDDTPDYRFGARDFNRKDLLSNAVLRWEYRPGSTLFVVWSQTRSGIDPQGDFGLGRDLDRLADLQPTNVLLIKASYWLSW
jgi:hypothetical protein